MAEIPNDIIAKLKEPLPNEAVSRHPTKTWMSSIKVIYMIERLNEVFGVGGWVDRYEFVTSQEKIRMDKSGEKEIFRYQMIVVKGSLSIPAYGIERVAYGGNDNEDLGDAYKGACTDAMSKMCSQLYIGMDVYKGMEEHGKARKEKAERLKTKVIEGPITAARSAPPYGMILHVKHAAATLTVVMTDNSVDTPGKQLQTEEGLPGMHLRAEVVEKIGNNGPYWDLSKVIKLWKPEPSAKKKGADIPEKDEYGQPINP